MRWLTIYFLDCMSRSMFCFQSTSEKGNQTFFRMDSDWDFCCRRQIQVSSTFSPLTRDRSRWHWQESHLPSFIQPQRGPAREREIKVNNSIQWCSGWKSHISVWFVICGSNEFWPLRILKFQTWTSAVRSSRWLQVCSHLHYKTSLSSLERA